LAWYLHNELQSVIAGSLYFGNVLRERFMKLGLIGAAVAALAFSSVANAAFPVYPTPGTQSTTANNFVSAGTGVVTAYFAGFDAAFDSRIGLSINGAAPLSFGLLNKTSALGESLVLGNVVAGDTLEFILQIGGSAPLYSTTASANTDGVDHAWSTAYAGGDFGIPAGIFVGFEDLPGGGDFDYNDHRFVFTFPGAVPEPGTWVMLVVGFGLVGASTRRRRTIIAA
jgi:hypothetical protein